MNTGSVRVLAIDSMKRAKRLSIKGRSGITQIDADDVYELTRALASLTTNNAAVGDERMFRATTPTAAFIAGVTGRTPAKRPEPKRSTCATSWPEPAAPMPSEGVIASLQPFRDDENELKQSELPTGGTLLPLKPKSKPRRKAPAKPAGTL